MQASTERLRASDFGRRLPALDRLLFGGDGLRQKVLLDTLVAFEEASDTRTFHHSAADNMSRWADEAVPLPNACVVRCLSGDWGEVAGRMSREYGVTFACLNMANASVPGGGYTDGMVAQEENMFRRTDCHFSLDRDSTMTLPPGGQEVYNAAFSALLNAEQGCVYLDVTTPRVCIRGAEDRVLPDLGYAWLPKDSVFPFFELRAAAVDLRPKKRKRARYDHDETKRRVAAQLDTLIEHSVRHAVLSAFGCGAFLNPADRVAAAYQEALAARPGAFDVIVFAIFDAGYGPDNYTLFVEVFGTEGPY